jgi:hypothetical protein
VDSNQKYQLIFITEVLSRMLILVDFLYESIIILLTIKVVLLTHQPLWATEDAINTEEQVCTS